MLRHRSCGCHGAIHHRQRWRILRCVFPGQRTSEASPSGKLTQVRPYAGPALPWWKTQTNKAGRFRDRRRKLKDPGVAKAQRSQPELDSTVKIPAVQGALFSLSLSSASAAFLISRVFGRFTPTSCFAMVIAARCLNSCLVRSPKNPKRDSVRNAAKMRPR